MANISPTTQRGRWLLRSMIAGVALLVLLGVTMPVLRVRWAAARVPRYHARVWYGPSISTQLDAFTTARKWNGAGPVVGVYRDAAVPLTRPETQQLMRLLTYFPHLQSLDLSQSELIDADFETIGRMRELSLLILFGSRVEGRNLDRLTGCRSLSSLQLLQIHFDQDLLDAVGRMSQLKRLNLTGSRLAGLDLSPLGRLPNLEALNLDDTDISDTEVTGLAGLRGLTEFTLSGNHVSEDAISRLREQVPIENYSDD